MIGSCLIGLHITQDQIQVPGPATDCSERSGSVPRVFGTEGPCLEVGTGLIEFRRRFLIKTVGSKKGFPFHSIILGLTGVGLGSAKGEVRKSDPL